MDNEGNKSGGRQKGTPNKATAEVRDLALDYGPEAVKELGRLAQEAKSETARISACNSILERAYGRPSTGRPIVIDLPDTSTADGITQAIAAIIQSAACGELTPDEASDLCGVVEAQRRAIELSDHEQRLAKIEAALEARQ